MVCAVASPISVLPIKRKAPKNLAARDLFWQSGFSQSFTPFRIMLLSSKGEQLIEVGKPQRRIELAHVVHQFPRILKPSHDRVTCRGATQGSKVIGRNG